MKSLFTYDNYAVYLRDFVYGVESYRGIQVRLAKSMGCQAAYFSQVLKGTAELTEDHAVKLVSHLGFNELEAEYFILLVRRSRAGTPELKGYLEKRRKKIIKQSEDLESKVNSKSLSDTETTLSKYFTGWMPSTIHIATSSKKYQTPESISVRLGIPLDLVKENLEFLRTAGLIFKKEENYVFSGESLHLPKSSQLDESHQINRRMQVLRSIQENHLDDLHFSSIFTLDPATFKELKQLAARLIEDSHKKIHQGGTEELYSICLDLFKIV